MWNPHDCNYVSSIVSAEFSILQGDHRGILIRRSQKESTSSSKKSSSSLGRSLSRTLSKGSSQIPKLFRQTSIKATKAVVQGATQVPKLARQASVGVVKTVQTVQKNYQKGQKKERLFYNSDYRPHSNYYDGQYNDHKTWK